MNHFELHEAAQQLTDTETAYSLARQVVELSDIIDRLQDHLPCDIDEIIGEDD